jgi:hypothetical protein
MHGRRSTMPLGATPSTMQTHWPPLLVIHGNADTVVSPHNAAASAQVWASAAGARASRARHVQRGKRYPMSVTDFKCKGSVVATLVAVDRLAHAWSGGLPASPSVTSRGRMRRAGRGALRPSNSGLVLERCRWALLAGLGDRQAFTQHAPRHAHGAIVALDLAALAPDSSTMRCMSCARSRFFGPSLMKPRLASIMKMPRRA